MGDPNKKLECCQKIERPGEGPKGLRECQLLICPVNPPETLKLKLIFSEMGTIKDKQMTGQRQPRKLTPLS